MSDLSLNPDDLADLRKSGPSKLSPKQTVHNWCHYCVQSRADADVENCTGYIVYATGQPCPFYPYRMADKRISVKVFRKFCLECMGGSARMVEECEKENCPIYPYRFGKNPARAGVGSIDNMGIKRKHPMEPKKATHGV